MYGRIETEEDEKLLCGDGSDDEVDPHREKEEIDKNSVLVELRIRKNVGDRIGNEDARLGQTNWSFLHSKEVYPGYDRAHELNNGHPDGDKWVAGECDVSIRPGWFFHASENAKVKTAEELMDRYYTSIGRNGTLLLNIPVNNEGLVSEVDSLHLMQFKALREKNFKDNLLAKAKVKGSSDMAKDYGGDKATDNDYDTFWAPKSTDNQPSLTLSMPKARRVNTLLLQEYIPMGQRVKSFTIEYQLKGKWMPVATDEETTTIGYKRIVRFAPVSTKKLRITFNDSRACPYINNVAAYLTD